MSTICPVGYDPSHPDKPVAGYAGGGGWVDQDFTAGGSSAVFTSTVNLGTQKMDVYVDGRLQNPTGYTVVTSPTNTVTFSETPQNGAWVRLRVYSF